MPFNPFSALTSKIFGALSLALLLACAALWWRGNHYEHKLDAARQTIAEMTAAQKVADAEQKRVNDESQRRQAELARKADNAENEAGELRKELEGLRAAADRFRASRSVRALCGSAPSQASAPAEDHPAGDHDRPGADLVVLTKPEYEQAVANSMRLWRVQQYGQSLITEGPAIPAAKARQP